MSAICRRRWPRGASQLVVAVGVAATLASHGPAVAQPPATTPAEAQRLDPVVVTPGRMQQRAGEAPASVTVIGAEDVRSSASLTVDDLLRQVPSFSLFRRSSSLVTHPTAQGVSLRGVGPSGASRALVLVDGVPVNDPFGGWVPWSRIPTLGIDQIEVVRGGGSAVWGNGALGGVIQILTRRPRARAFELEASHGSYDTTNVDALVTDAEGPFRLMLEGTWFETGGFPIVRRSRRGPIDIDADSAHAAVNGRVEILARSDLTLFLAGTYFDEERQNGTPLQLNDTWHGTLATGGTLTTPDGSEWTLTLHGQTQEFHSTFSSQALDRASETLALDQRSPATSFGGTLSWLRPVGDHTLLAGIDARWIEGETDEDVFGPAGFLRRRVAGGEQLFAGVFVQDTIRLSPQWELVAGIRADYFTTYSGARRDTPPPAGVPARQQFPDIGHVIASPRVGLLFRPVPGTDVYASAYQGFRAPTLNELYRVFRVRNDVTAANERLAPERLTGGELGVRQRWSAVEARVTGFWNEVKDQILNVTLTTPLPDCPADTTCRQRRNVGLTRVRGVEAEVEVRPHPAVRLLASHLWSDAEVVDAPAQPALEGKRLAQVPEHVTALGATWSDPRWLTLAATVRLVGGQFEDDLNTLPLGRYTVVDVHVSRALGRWATAFLAVENLFDETFAVARTSEGVVSIGTPRLVHGGVRLRF
jgi:outer membrane receptor protein involved in Fe transport